MNNEPSISDNANVNDNEKPNVNDNEQSRKTPSKEFVRIDMETNTETILMTDNGVVITMTNNNESSPVLSEYVLDMEIKSDPLPLNASKHSPILRLDQKGQTTTQSLTEARQKSPKKTQWWPSATFNQNQNPSRGYRLNPGRGYRLNPAQGYQWHPPQGPGQGKYPPHPPPPHMQAYPMYPDSDRQPLDYSQSRNDFVVKVMMVTTIMLLITATLIAYVLSNNEAQLYVKRNIFLLMIAALVGMIIVNIGYCFPYSRAPPCNFILAILIVMSMSIVAVVVTVIYKTSATVYAALATAGVTLVCLLLALSSFDFTSYMLYIVVVVTGISMVGLIILIASVFLGFYTKPLHIIILLVFVVAQAVVLTMQLQMILGGKTIEMGEDEWLISAVMLYSSIVNIFIQLVQILGLSDLL